MIKWGIWSTGHMAHVFAKTLNSIKDQDHRLHAVASRNLSKAEAFRSEFDAHAAYESLEALAASDVDIIYVASPHLFHAKDMDIIIQGKKHILCEKAFTMNHKEAQHIISTATANNLFVMEALWTRFLPVYTQAKNWINEGKIGDIRMMHINLTSYKDFDPNHRLFDKQQGGGALLDLGVYCLSILQYFMGNPTHIQSHHLLNSVDTDQCASGILHYEKPQMANFNISFDGATNRDAYILGTMGHIRIEDPFHAAQKIHLYQNNQIVESLHLPFDASSEGLGYVYEILAVGEALSKNWVEHPTMSHQDTLAVMQQMDMIRNNWGLVYKNDQ